MSTICAECKECLEYPTGEIIDGNFTCRACLDKVERARMNYSMNIMKYFYAGALAFIVILLLIRFIKC